jgi:predicted nucleotidyltransferase
MPDALDPLPLLRVLHERGIEHIVVGGFAVNAHGFIRVTKDLDIVPSPSEENLEKLAEMLQDVGATILDSGDFQPEEMPADPTSAADLARGGNFCLLTELGRLDVMQWLSGVEADDLYAEFDQDAVEGNLDGVPVRVCGLEHLRAMKRAAGRPQDLEDLERLADA